MNSYYSNNKKPYKRLEVFKNLENKQDELKLMMDNLEQYQYNHFNFINISNLITKNLGVSFYNNNMNYYKKNKEIIFYEPNTCIDKELLYLLNN